MSGGILRRWDGTQFLPPVEVEFVPASIPDLHTYLNADDLSAGTIGVWPDSSVNGHDYTTAGFFHGPTVMAGGINGHNIVRFASVNVGAPADALRWQGTGLSGDYHFFIVARMLAGTHARLFGSIYPDNANFTGGWHGGNEAAFYNGSVFLAGGGQPVTTGIWRRMEESGSGTTTGYMNGALWGFVSGGSGFAGGVALSGYGMAVDTECSDFDVACIVIYNRNLTGPERDAINAWLVTKFAL